jgi:hypothetical protein
MRFIIKHLIPPMRSILMRISTLVGVAALAVAFAAQARALFGARRIIELNIFVRLRK